MLIHWNPLSLQKTRHSWTSTKVLSLPSEVEILITTRLLCLKLHHGTWNDNKDNMVFQSIPSSPKDKFSSRILSNIQLFLHRIILHITKPVSELFLLGFEPLTKCFKFYPVNHTYPLGKAGWLTHTVVQTTKKSSHSYYSAVVHS